ncbi:MAG: MASE4 domain-containing protein [Alphaproteobacteria bacterium]|nr:MASE4 domain-containing protein [Alphaproteobacteria bacterium]MBU1515167.1 MASE4 domain-containing protein [Alphaproteobacteria bacterium]MBU2092297.1 MASE4 domain-containing protein [Alphaproteobacteria bacterium]MBU2152891.1 MASE4 domain-containing protein [Alphaproteobacteria bacterium]MBU2305722.1 MASE4 domain-containing protein [Alphaproteobacteria bacterium]
MQATGADDPTGEALVLTSAAPGRRHKLVAFAIVPALLAALFVLTRPFAEIQLPPAPAFVPIQTSALFVINLVTALLFFCQYWILRSRPLLVVANGYLYAALVLIPYLLAFPGLFVTGGTLVGGLQSTAWLYILRHCGLAASLVAFALISRGEWRRPQQVKGDVPLVLSVVATCALVMVIATVCIAADGHLPVVASDGRRFSTGWLIYAGAPMASLYGLAVILLWPLRNTVLGLWLLVVASVHLAAVPISFFGSPSRFSVSWYTVVIINLVANSLVLAVLLVEVSNLYRRLLEAVRAQQHEREARLATGDALAAMIAHELRQPLLAIVMRAATSVRRLDRPAPDVEKAIADLGKITADGHRAGAILDSIRANFRRDIRTRASMDLNQVASETVALVRRDLRKQQVRVQMALNARPADVAGDRTQIQQVLLNLISNAAEATAGSPAPRLLTITSENGEGNEICVSVCDNGAGVSAEHLAQLFNPLFTTKATGMGMGLSICRSIVEAHGGRIWASPNSPNGAVFQFTLARLANA